MEPTRESTARFRRRFMGYDRREVEGALASSNELLRRARAERDELRATAANLDRVGAEVADMLRALAERAAELEVGAAAAAEQTLREARADADAIRAEAAAMLAETQRQAEEALAAAREREAAVGRQRQLAVVALRLAMEEIGRLAGSVEELNIPTTVQVSRSADVLEAMRASEATRPESAPDGPARDADDVGATAPQVAPWRSPEDDSSITLTLRDGATASDHTEDRSEPSASEEGADEAHPADPSTGGGSTGRSDDDVAHGDVDELAEARARIREWTSASP